MVPGPEGPERSHHGDEVMQDPICGLSKASWFCFSIFSMCPRSFSCRDQGFGLLVGMSRMRGRAIRRDPMVERIRYCLERSDSKAGSSAVAGAMESRTRD
jgi:hypothetical protein